MNKYKAFYNGKEIIVEAKTSYEAQQDAIKQFYPPKNRRHMVHVYLVDKADSGPVTHSASEI